MPHSRPRYHRLAGAVLLAVSLRAATGHGADAFSDGDRAYQARDYARAERLLRPLADAGHPAAQTRLGLMHFHGLGVREDERAAFELFRRAALRGHAEAQYHLGNMYLFGHAPADPATDADREAARWFYESAEQNHADAQYALGILFFSGKGVIHSPPEAEKWFRRAANNGHHDAQRYLGMPERR